MQLSPVVDALINVFAEHHAPHKDERHFAVSRAVSILAAAYEKARNAVEFRAEHLIRRAAIERILKRRILLNGGSRATAENLIVELLWARYIDSSQVDEEGATEIQRVIDRYMVIKQLYFDTKKDTKGISWDLLLGLASSEVEELIISSKKREALNNFLYQAVRPQISSPGEDEKLLNLLTYIAVERAYAQSDKELILFHVLRMIKPDWLTATKETAATQIPDLFETILYAERAFKHPLHDKIFRYIRRQVPPFLLLRDFFDEKGAHAREIIEKPEEFEHVLSTIASQRYQEIGKKIRRSVVRSIVYLFFTKMIFAFALEAPVDIFIFKHIDYLPLAINSLFPPFLLFLIAGFISVPGGENTHRLINRIKRIMYQFDDVTREKVTIQVKGHIRRPVLTAIFSTIYLAAFAISFGMISLVLTKLHFNIASQIIFVFFVTLVSFFAYRIRLSAKEYEMVDRQGLLSPIVDFFFLPILRVGHLLSSEIARINIFIFVFDFILEAPLKVIFEVIEEWIRFMRTKKEEII